MTDQRDQAPEHHDGVNPIEDIGDAARDVAETFRRINSQLLRAMLITYAVATGVTVGVVLLNPVRDWYLFLAMFLVILAYLIAYIKAHQNRRRALRFVSLLVTEGLLAFWCFILIDRIPARKVFIDGAVHERDAMPLLWVSAVLLMVVALALLVHWAWVGRLQKRAVA